MNNKLRIAIDGPAASGKSTTAKLVAKKLSYLYIDTGAMYRAVTLAALQKRVNLDDGTSLTRLAEKCEILLKEDNDRIVTLLNNQDVSEQIRSPEVTRAISTVSAHKDLRALMVKKQQQLAAGGGVVMDGRDIGTHVLPDAEIKVFMVAGIKERAKRRYHELQAKGVKTSLDEITADIERRDRMDATRATAPLTAAKDAIHIDTSMLTIAQQVDKVLQLVSDYLQAQNN
jgi:cytidylate kinase